ncbi:MAG: amidohydrolase family protein [Oscillospiraceae bacterium]|nr:amidohydrolase family protein [Oscillospiraceae bacterium]
MEAMIPVTDAHCHVFPELIADRSRDAVAAFYELPMYTTGTAAHLKAERERPICIGGQDYRIVRQLVCAPAVTPHQTHSVNAFISALVREDPALIGLGTLHPGNEDAPALLGTFREQGLVGLKLHSDFQRFPIDDPGMYPVYEEAIRLGLPVLFHMGDRKLDYSHPARLRRLMQDLPGLTVIAAHTGGYSHWKDALALLEPSERLYFDISSTLQFITGDLLADFLDRFGAGHFFFGSDFPMWDPVRELETLLSFSLPDAVLPGLLHGNFSRFWADHV